MIQVFFSPKVRPNSRKYPVNASATEMAVIVHRIAAAQIDNGVNETEIPPTRATVWHCRDLRD